MNLPSGGFHFTLMAWISPLERVPLQDLRVRHRHAITELRAALEGDLEEAGKPAYADDTWLLRYILSYPESVESAAAAARKAVQWRQENRDLVEAARQRRVPVEFTPEELRAITLFFAAAYLGTSQFGDPLFVCRLGAYNLPALMEQVSEDKLELWFSFVNECAWQYCEAATRDRGILVKQINIQDASGVSMSKDRRFFGALGKSSKTNEWLRPQLIGKTYVFNSPIWMNVAWKFAGNFMSRKSIEKVSIHPRKVSGSLRAAPDVEGSEEACCPFASSLLGGDKAIPTFLGGTLDCDDVLPGTARPTSSFRSAVSKAGHGESAASLASDPCLDEFLQPPLLAGLPPLKQAEPPKPRKEVPKEDPALVAAAAAAALVGHDLNTSQVPLSMDDGSYVTAIGPPEADEMSACSRCWSRLCCRRRRHVSQIDGNVLLSQS